MLPDAPLVTIVTPSFNQGGFIRATIESVLSQDYPNIEYLVMDGGSTDETASVVSEYSSRLTFISEKDRGQSDAINKGFRMGRGAVMAWLNSDDIYLPGAVSAAVEAFKNKPDAGAVYGEGYQMDRDDRERRRFPCTQKPDLWRLVHLSDYILQQSTYFRKDVLEDVGYVDESLHYVMDWDLLIRIGLRYPLAYIPQYMGCIREYPEAKTFAGGERRIDEIRTILHRHTGRRLPPGLIVYALESRREKWKAWIRDWSPGKLQAAGRLSERVLETAVNLFIGRTIYHCQGLYPDGWVAPRCQLMLPPGRGPVVLEGEAPGGSHAMPGQTITVECNGVRIAWETLPQGAFRFAFDADQLNSDGPLHFVIRSRRSVWSNPTEPVTGRRICWRLIDFRRETQTAGAAEQPRPGEDLAMSARR